MQTLQTWFGCCEYWALCNLPPWIAQKCFLDIWSPASHFYIFFLQGVFDFNIDKCLSSQSGCLRLVECGYTLVFLVIPCFHWPLINYWLFECSWYLCFERRYCNILLKAINVSYLKWLLIDIYKSDNFAYNKHCNWRRVGISETVSLKNLISEMHVYYNVNF